MSFVEPALVAINTVSGDVAIWLYGDIKGSAWAKILGVTIASIDVSAYARFHGCGSVSDAGIEIKKIEAKAGFDWSVRIGCVNYSGSAEFEVVVVNRGDCGRFASPAPHGAFRRALAAGDGRAPQAAAIPHVLSAQY